MTSKEKQIETLLNKALFFLQFRARTVKEMRAYLEKKTETLMFNKEHVKEVINYLKERNYLDDEEFAKFFIESRAKTKPKGIYVIRRELEQKGVEGNTIEKLLLEINLDEKSLAQRALQKKMSSWTGLDKKKKKQQAYAYLSRKGFSYDIIKKACEEMDAE